MISIEKDSKIRLHYRVTDDVGNVFSETFSSQPLELVVGSGDLLDTIESQLIGLQRKQQKQFSLSAEDAYGEYDDKRIFILSRDQFPDELEICEGVIVSFTTPTGDEIAGVVKDLNEYAVEVDFNHPLAGVTVTVDVEIVDILAEKPATRKDEVM